MENVDKSGRMPSQIMEDILEVYDVPTEKQVHCTASNSLRVAGY